MVSNIGAIFIDVLHDRIFLQIYRCEGFSRFTLLKSDNFRIGIKMKGESASGYIRILSEAMFTGIGLHVADWKVISRGAGKSIRSKIIQASGLAVEELDIKREQELLLKGAVMETA